MITSAPTTRRHFLKTAAGVSAFAAATGPAVSAAVRARSPGASERIRIGLIGCGNRAMSYHLPGLQEHSAAANVEVVAVCDPWRIAREKTAAAVEKHFGRAPRKCRSYRELLSLPEVDAVMIGSPDHLHTLHLEAAARAGKHAYVEKPLGIDHDELVRACDAVKESGIIVQVGTQQRSEPIVAGCRELLRSGVLGPVSRVEQVRNSTKPYWYHYMKPDVRKEDLDWAEFTHGRTARKFDPILYSGWYGYYEFSQGPVAQWGSHYIDLVHFITGLSVPQSCVCLGGIYTWKDEHRFTAPDQMHALWHYPEGAMISYATNFGNSAGNSTRIFGQNGTLSLDRSQGEASYSAEGGLRRDGSIRGKNAVARIDRPAHILDWLQCLRSGGTPHAPIDAGYRHAVATIMAATSYETGRRVSYDSTRRAITAG
jgi:predicted dehydrogenase